MIASSDRAADLESVAAAALRSAAEYSAIMPLLAGLPKRQVARQVCNSLRQALASTTAAREWRQRNNTTRRVRRY